MSKTLVFGASLKPDRYSNLAVKCLLGHNIETEAFGLREGKIENVHIKTDLRGFQNIHTITLYMNPKLQRGYYQDIMAMHPQRVIFNPGTENPEFYKMLEAQNIEVEEACTLVLLATDQF